MPDLSALNDPAAVRETLDEFDRLGRPTFLQTYGFGRARSYFVVERGTWYDSKAVFGVAYGRQHPQRGPLRARDFSGGEQTVAARLRDLGFEVRNVAPHAGERSYWALLAMPTLYEIEEAVRKFDVDWWTTGRSAVRRGDRVAIWRAAGGDGRRGIVALGEVWGDPEERTDADNPLWLAPGAGDEVKLRVPVRYVTPPNLPLWVGRDGSEILEELSVFRGRGGSVFRITPEQWEAVVDAAGGWTGPSEEAADVDTFVSPLGGEGPRGQGFLADAELRRLVELRAMELATAHYRERWPVVRDVSRTDSCDLICEDGERRLYVEVQGTRRMGESVILTRNEVALSRTEYPHTALFVVSRIAIEVDDHARPVAGGGVVRELHPWRASDDMLTPISYDCSLDRPSNSSAAEPQSSRTTSIAG